MSVHNLSEDILTKLIQIFCLQCMLWSYTNRKHHNSEPYLQYHYSIVTMYDFREDNSKIMLLHRINSRIRLWVYFYVLFSLRPQTVIACLLAKDSQQWNKVFNTTSSNFCMRVNCLVKDLCRLKNVSPLIAAKFID